jgi:hypothetical protein
MSDDANQPVGNRPDRVPRGSAHPGRAARIVSWGLGLSLAGAAAAGPALAEAQVQSRLRERYAIDDDFAVDLDLGGLELRGLSHELPDGRGHVRAQRVRIRPSFEGMVVEVEGLDANLQRARRPVAKPAKPTSDAAPPRPTKRSEQPDPLARMLKRLRGIPIEIVVDGTIAIELGDGLSAVASNPRVQLPGDGRIDADTLLDLHSVNSPDGSSWAEAALHVSTTDADPRDLRVTGMLALADVDSSGAAQLSISGRASAQTLSFELREAEGGWASIAVERAAADGRDHARLEAEALPLQLLEPIAGLFGRRLGDAIGEREGDIDLHDARLSGAVELVRGAKLTRARFEAVELSQLRIDSELLSAKPIELSGLTIDGELTREHTHDGPRNSGALVLEHRGVQLELSGQLDATGLSFSAQLPTTSCQALLDATPGISPVLAGTVLSGELEAEFALDLDFAELALARARYLGPDAEDLDVHGKDEFQPPGELRFSLPFIERCAVERLGPGADVEGLRGAYHHRFVSGSGAETRRVLAIGDDDYVTLEQVPKVALAFVILEDARFWEHDGFDREQIERAFWFNLFEGRVSRGASTISQQVARSLWLGVDRSITRKLAEAVLAAELERGLDKERILEVYLNIIELGPEVHGIVEASRYHFGKQPAELELLEALHLASLAPAPVGYSRRFADGQIDREWREHLRTQVRRLRIRHLISRHEAETALRANLELVPHPSKPAAGQTSSRP